MNFTKIKLSKIVKAKKNLGNLVISSCPGISNSRFDKFTYKKDLTIIIDLNISLVVSLIELNEIRSFEINEFHKDLEENNVRAYSMPIKNYGIPAQIKKNEYIQIIRDCGTQLELNKNVYLHCYAGLGRSGMFASLILKALGLDSKQCINHVRNCRPGTIETEEQEKFVINF